MNCQVAPESLLLTRIDAAVEEARQRAPGAVHCGKGCFGCCLGPFPITRGDALRLHAGLYTLGAAEIALLQGKAREVLAKLPPRPAGDWLYSPEFRMLPCPLLDLEAGACGLYDHRPLACRTFGAAIEFDGTELDVCNLNYTGWTPEQIEAVRVSVPLDGLRAALEGSVSDSPLTTVAQALVDFSVLATPEGNPSLR